MNNLIECNFCNGRGFVGYFVCSKCLGKGKLDWVDNVLGRKSNKVFNNSYYIDTIECDENIQIGSLVSITSNGKIGLLKNEEGELVIGIAIKTSIMKEGKYQTQVIINGYK